MQVAMKLKPIGSLLPKGKQEFRMIERQIFCRRPKPAEWVILPPPRYSILVARMCHLCESIEIFPNTIRFELHLSRFHTAPFSCPYCPKNFQYTFHLSRHMIVRHPKETLIILPTITYDWLNHFTKKYITSWYTIAFFFKLHF